MAFVLSGGGNLGALQVGMLRALADREIRPDLVVGCSVGALNGAAYAADPTPAGVARLEALWRGLEGDEIMPTGWLPTSVQLARKGASLQDNEGLKATIDRILFRETFGELEVPFQCVATSIQPVGERWFATGALKPAILASAALPAGTLPSCFVSFSAASTPSPVRLSVAPTSMVSTSSPYFSSQMVGKAE